MEWEGEDEGKMEGSNFIDIWILLLIVRFVIWRLQIQHLRIGLLLGIIIAQKLEWTKWIKRNQKEHLRLQPI